MVCGTESYALCLKAAVILLTALDAHQPFPEQAPTDMTLGEFWSRLEHHIHINKSLSIVETILPLLGLLLSQIRASYSVSQELKTTALRSWSAHVSRNSFPDVVSDCEPCILGKDRSNEFFSGITAERGRLEVLAVHDTFSSRNLPRG